MWSSTVMSSDSQKGYARYLLCISSGTGMNYFGRSGGTLIRGIYDPT
jgi:hypothetical protein